ncbi:MAG: 3-isopropylmalate dehydratase large subunit [Deltaproteobacteria bacterium]|nr:3-isopropylmalate dehydratase large subunit [Deltaproteobacteria bacterium]NIS78584.1 3-isopropylmalate dehydratase large subunit [Deltaproteobacteria bacterium]
MGMTLTEKIIAAHAGLERVEPGQLVLAGVDLALGNDITSPIAIKQFESAGIEEVFDAGKVALVPDHFTPNKDIKSAEQVKMMRDFSRKFRIENFFDIGEMGIEHVLLPDRGLVVPGDLVIGADSHTCTYGALCAFSSGVGSTDLAAAMMSGEVWLKVPESILFLLEGKPGRWVEGKDIILYIIGDIGVDGALYRSMEYGGSGLSHLTMAWRFTMANMAIEAGAKNGIFPFDGITREYAEKHAKRAFRVFEADANARYVDVKTYDLSTLEPQVAFPHLPENTRPISSVGNIEIDQVVIGSCTNGRIEDLRSAAEVLRGKRVNGNLRMIVIPATQEIYLQALREGLIELFVSAGGVVSTPTCGPCLGGHMGVLAEGERAVATTNRNFVGRMGHPGSEVYLANPAVAAASAVAGRIAGPDEVL